MDSDQADDIVADDSFLREQGMAPGLIARELYGLGPIHCTNQNVIVKGPIEHNRSATSLALASIASLVGRSKQNFP